MKYLFCVVIFLLSVSQAQAAIPCWFNQPAGGSYTGFIGNAALFSATANGSLISSRKKLLNDLFAYHNLDLTLMENKEIAGKKLVIDEHRSILFAPSYTHKTGLYSYGVLLDSTSKHQKRKLQNWLNQKCEIPACDLQQCSPKWLCQSQSNTILGVSQMTARPSRQMELARKNAQQLSTYLQASEVSHQSVRVSEVTSQSRFGFSHSKGQTIPLGQKEKLLPLRQCYAKDLLLMQFQTPQPMKQPQKSFEVWRFQPNLPNNTGVVGTFDGMTADGRMSTAVDAAIKDGLLSLAKTRKVTIEHQMVVKQEKGTYMLTRLKESTEAIVSATLMDIRITQSQNKLKIYAWLLEKI